jgi:ATP-dependent DNA helicase RecG
MFLRELTQSAASIRGAGQKTAGLLAAAGIHSVAALLARYPRTWENRARAVPLRDWAAGPVSTTISVIAHDWFGYGAAKTLKIYVEDESARAVLVCFNRSFLKNQLAVGNRYRLWGRFGYRYGELQSSAFETEPESAALPGILPVYPLSAGLSQQLLRRLMREALRQYGGVDDEIPASVAVSRSLLPKAAALRAVHFPENMDELEKARQTLIYEELFYLETVIARRVLARKMGNPPKGGVAGPGIKKITHAPPQRTAFSPLQQRLLDRLPFRLTPGQEQAVAEINTDMAFQTMARLLQGDVGSGKTLVAFLAALRAVEEGGQAAVMAPTELLARQHAETAARLIEPLGIRPAYLDGNLKAAGRVRLLKALAAGEIDIALGTHALFSKDTVYRKLRLVVVDEQHRFGVVQRQTILSKSETSIEGGEGHLLMMSATPIPRTLALTVFGDLDVSVITDIPPGRKPVKTHLAKESGAGRVYDFVCGELRAGRQAYFVYPFIDEDEQAKSASASVMAETLAREIFPGHSVALVHSRLDDEQKRKAMEAFRTGEVQILAATSVVEVGVDVPNASCMVIHHAERFGLSALHQLRGRVGRGREQAYCFLIYSETETEDGDRRPALTGEGKQRLKVMLENNDGFVIAEEDLKLRGPGQIAGIEQSGYLSLGIADPVRDADTLLAARKDAFAMLGNDPGLFLPENRRVAEVLERAPPFNEACV